MRFLEESLASTVEESNETARAHELNKIDDWVVLYFERGGSQGQATVVTESHGPLEGKRVVRGREAGCRRYYQKREAYQNQREGE